MKSSVPAATITWPCRGDGGFPSVSGCDQVRVSRKVNSLTSEEKARKNMRNRPKLHFPASRDVQSRKWPWRRSLQLANPVQVCLNTSRAGEFTTLHACPFHWALGNYSLLRPGTAPEFKRMSLLLPWQAFRVFLFQDSIFNWFAGSMGGGTTFKVSRAC